MPSALGLAERPAGAAWAQVYGIALLCGIGFTMSLFIGGLAFADPQHETAVKLGVLAGSALSGLAGAAILRLAPPRTAPAIARPGSAARKNALPRGGMRFYLGLATTFHDPALALVGPDGTLLFAEAAERDLQYKRAPNCEPDAPARMAALLKDARPARLRTRRRLDLGAAIQPTSCAGRPEPGPST